MHLEQDDALARAAAADHGVLATMNKTGVPDLVPACFAIVERWLVVPIDSVKPKGSTALGRVRNLDRDPRATLLIEHWDARNWDCLWWVRLSLRKMAAPKGTTSALVQSLRDRYPQYRDAPFTEVLIFRIDKVGGWSASRPG